MCGIRKGRQRGLLIPMGEGSGIRATDGVSDINTHKTGHPLPIGRVIDLPSSRKPGNGKSWQITNLFQYLYVYIYMDSLVHPRITKAGDIHGYTIWVCLKIKYETQWMTIIFPTQVAPEVGFPWYSPFSDTSIC